MAPKIDSGQLVTVAPINDVPQVGDIVLCKMRGAHYLHLIKGVSGDTYQIGNNRGHINGWTTRKNIYGKVIKVAK